MSPEFVGAPPPERFADWYRAWHRTAPQIRAGGAIGSLSQGIDMTCHGVDTRVVAAD